MITARNEGEITAAAQAVSTAHAGRRAIGVVATASSAEDFERLRAQEIADAGHFTLNQKPEEIADRAICVPFRARHLRFATVSHGHS